MSDQDIVVRISGLGGSSEASVSDGATVADALQEANIDVSGSGLDVKVNGESVDLSTPVQSGDQVVTAPQNVKLG